MSLETPTRWATRAVLAVLHEIQARDDAAGRAFVEQQLAETGFSGLDIEPDGVGVRLVMAQATAVHLCKTFATLLDTAGATNYIEQEVVDRATGVGKYRYIVVRPGRPGPHELRQIAERRAERAEARLADLEQELAELRQASR